MNTLVFSRSSEGVKTQHLENTRGVPNCTHSSKIIPTSRFLSDVRNIPGLKCTPSSRNLSSLEMMSFSTVSPRSSTVQGRNSSGLRKTFREPNPYKSTVLSRKGEIAGHSNLGLGPFPASNNSRPRITKVPKACSHQQLRQRCSPSTRKLRSKFHAHIGNRLITPLRKSKCFVCDQITPADVGHRVLKFPLSGDDAEPQIFGLSGRSGEEQRTTSHPVTLPSHSSVTANAEAHPISLPSYSIEGYNEWHHSAHVLEGLVSAPEEQEDEFGDAADLVGERSESHFEASGRSFSVQVLTKQEQLELAATPAHPAALTAFYFSHCLNCLSEHSWRFLSAALLSLLHQSLLPVACASFVGQLIIFIGAPWVGHFMDSTPRVTAFNTLCIVQTAAMVISALATIYGLRHPPAATLSGGALLRQPWFLAVMAAGAVDKLTGLASGVAFERDWVILLAGQNRPIALASANAILRRVDLFCELAGPMSFGWLLSGFKPLFCVNVSLALTLVSLPILLFLVHTTDRLSSGALGRPRPVVAEKAQRSFDEVERSQGSDCKGSASMSSKGHHPPAPASRPDANIDDSTNPLDAIMSGWRSFLGQSVLPASLAYVLLYFNAVLSPGGLMTSFLTQRGVDVSVIGAFRGACAAMGFAATFVSAPLVARLGLLQAGAGALIFQTLLLAASVAVFFASRADQKVLLMIFLALVVFSRLGHWVYDVVDAQIFQTAVPTSEANLVGTTEIALASLAELTMLGTAIVLHDISRFGQLALMSMAAVAGATVIYCSWLARPDAKRNALFPRRPEWAFGRDEEKTTGSLLHEMDMLGATL